MCAVGDAIQQRLAQSRIRKHLGPFRERQIGDHDQRGAFGSLGDHLKQELRTSISGVDIMRARPVLPLSRGAQE